MLRQIRGKEEMNLNLLSIIRRDQCGITERSSPSSLNEMAPHSADQPSAFQMAQVVVVRTTGSEVP